MEKSKTSNRYSPELRARAVRMVLEHQGSYETQSAAVAAIAPKIGCIPETLRVWVRQAEKDSGARDGATSAERDKIKELEREVRQLLQANEILRKASAYFAQVRRALRHCFSSARSDSTARSSQVVSRMWWKFSCGDLRALGFGPDQATRSRVIGSMG